jgi:hypothetical protein
MNAHIPNRPISDVWREAAETWVDLDSAARLLEETKSAVLAKWMSEMGDVAVNKAERDVKASDRWRDYIEKTVRARTAAEKAKIEMRWHEMKVWDQRSREATERTQARI